jgi:hypothetical protein
MWALQRDAWRADRREADRAARVCPLGRLALGILTAISGFVGMGGIIAAAQAGARYRFALLWTLILGTIGLVVYADM